MTDFSVPGINDADPIGDKPQAPVNKAFPGHVVVDQPKGPSTWQTVRDFVPSAAKKGQILRARGLVSKKEVPVVKVRKLHGIDYMSHADSCKITKKKGAVIKRLATEMLKAREEELRRYKIAEKIVAKATAAEMKKPSPRLAKALSILDKGPPITQKEALQQARDRVFREYM